MHNTQCAIGDHIYTFFGGWPDDEYGFEILDSFERLNAQDDISGRNA